MRLPSTSCRLLLGLILLVVWSTPLVAADPKKKKNEDEILELMSTFSETFEQIERNYVKDIDRRRLVEAAIRGMLKELDQYSNYISPEQLSRFNQSVSQEFGGIGIQVTPGLTVMTPLPGTPAYKAGIRAGDRIVEIAGQKTDSFPQGGELQKAVSLLKGKPGESVSLGLRRAGVKEMIKVEVTRAIIKVPTVLGDRYGKDDQWNYLLDDKNKIGYVRLTHFARRTADELETAMKKLKTQGARAVVLDLRFNPGGLLSQATRVSDLFIESGRIVSTKGRNIRERTWDATKRGTISDLPMAVLVNHFSASASEIVSACLQDHKRAVVIGERTWGKGSVQNVIQIEGGSSALKLTTASYHRPSGRNIHRFPNSKPTDVWGVMPDKGFDIKMSRLEMIQYQEYRRQRDVLSKEGPPKSDFKDKQLDKALAYLVETLNPDKKKKDGDKKKAAKKKKDSDKKKAAKKKKDSDKKKDGDKKKTAPEKKSEKKEAAGNGRKPQALRLPLLRMPDLAT